MEKKNPDRFLQDEFAQALLDRSAESEPLGSVTYYDPDGDFVEFRSTSKSFNAERVSSVLTVYYDRDSHELIGSRIKGVQYLLHKFPTLSIEARDGKILLSHLIVAVSGEGAQTRNETLELSYQRVYRSLLNLVRDGVIESREMVAAKS